MLEQLEGRVLFSSSLADGVLTITGTKRGDTVDIEHRDFLTGRVVIVMLNERPLHWSSGPRADGSVPVHIVVRGRGGNDDIRMRGQVTSGNIRLSVHGGPGNDVITAKGGHFISRIHGGGGDDVITAFSGDRDTLLGGAGNDLIQTYSVSGNPDDRHYVRRGSTTPVPGVQGSILVGGDGDDTLVGSIYNDRLVGGPGRDALFGDNGKDTLKGGAGVDCYAGDIGEACLP